MAHADGIKDPLLHLRDIGLIQVHWIALAGDGGNVAARAYHLVAVLKTPRRTL